MDKENSPNEPIDKLGMTDEQWERFQAYTRGYGAITASKYEC